MNIDTSSAPVAGASRAEAPAPSLPQQNPPSQPAPARPDAAALRDAVRAANAALKPLSNNLEFSVDQHSGRTVVRIVDADTQQLIRQLPSEEMLAIARALDKLQGMLIEDRA